ncbi:MAG: glycosyl hydrolase family 18 protein [Armatimonadota bacterium]
MKKRIFLWLVLSVIISGIIFWSLGCTGGSVVGESSDDNNDAPATTSVNLLQSAYIQLGATDSLSTITRGGVNSLDVIIFAFGNIASSSIDNSYLTWMQTFINHRNPNSVIFLSIGGETVRPEHITAAGGSSAIVTNIVAQIHSYNNSLAGGSITGVDLDLENAIDAATINSLAKGFKDAGLIVCTAPQVYLSSGASVDPSNPTNMVLTSGGALATTNTYGTAISNGYVDYIMVQTYNSGGITINGYAENNVQFFKAVSNALNSSRGILSIPDHTKIFVGQVANQCAGGQYNIFNPNLGWPFPVVYDQQAILNQLKTDILSMESDSTNYGNISGVMVWSLNNDYMPTGWSDTYATSGAFTRTIFGASD